MALLCVARRGFFVWMGRVCGDGMMMGWCEDGMMMGWCEDGMMMG